jgi:H+/Cl- antiporter ClcA/predicted transcriptional regulator
MNQNQPAPKSGSAGERNEHRVEEAQTVSEGLPVAPSMGPTVASLQLPMERRPIDRRAMVACGLAICIGALAAFIARGLLQLIAFCTSVSFYGKVSFDIHGTTPWNNQLGWWVIFVPVIGAIIVGIMARYGSKAIRGHGIPEAMERVLLGESRIPLRVMFLKPLSAAVAIGTGGPFGAEGPIIATGSALGSVVGQYIPSSSEERKVLLACGAAAGMAATFGSPVSAVLLAVELLLFEFRPRSLIPVALASAVAAGIRIIFEGTAPVFPMPPIDAPSSAALVSYIVLGAIIGVIAVIVTRAVYAVEDAFEKLPIHWMWWPAVGAVAVGVIGYYHPRTLGVGYTNISDILKGNWPLYSLGVLCAAKFVSWAIYLGSGTSGGTLAPLFTIGGAVGALLGAAINHFLPSAQVSISVAALVGMAAIFAGSARALLASVVFAFEATLQPLGLLPLLGGCSAAFLVSSLLMRHTIMTEKIARRGVRVPEEYTADFLDSVLVREMMSDDVVTLRADQTVAQVREWMAKRTPESLHQGYPVVNDSRILLGVVTRRMLLHEDGVATRSMMDLIQRPPIVVYDDLSLRAAADHMVNHDIGRLPVISRIQPGKLVGIITRSDLLRAHRKRIADNAI